MSNTIKPQEIPKEYRKNKKFNLFKAYKLEDGDEMNVAVDGDIYYLNSVDACERLINDLQIESTEEFIGETISILTVSLNTEDVDFDVVLMNADGKSVSIAIKEYEYTMKCKDFKVKKFSYDIDPQTDMRNIVELSIDDVE